MTHKQGQDNANLSAFFTKDISESYDEKNRALAPIAENMHFLIRLILRNLPEHARILCVGVGTGAEIISLSKAYPEWTFVGVDPSAAMLEVCRKNLVRAGALERCTLIHGYIEDAPEGKNFDAVLSVLVAHFIDREKRVDFYRNMHERLKVEGYFISTEISFDLNSAAFPSMLKNWEAVQILMGAEAESLQSLPRTLKETLCVLPPAEVESLMLASGLSMPVRFFQSFMISGWYGRK